MIASAEETMVLEARNLRQTYMVGGGLFAKRARLEALREASLRLRAGRVLAIVGESGCGKSTLARILTMIEPPAGGSLSICGREVFSDSDNGQATPQSRRRVKELRQKVQMVFQDPRLSLNPRRRIEAILAEPLVINLRLTAAERQERVAAMLEQVGLETAMMRRYPHMLSGGQRQRVAIARALMLNPALLVADEPVSALDISIQAQILNLLSQLQNRYRLAMIFISHDLAVARHIAHEVLVMYLGRVVERGATEDIFRRPSHPYTRALLASTPIADPRRPRKEKEIFGGEPPSPLAPPPGCAFHRRCPLAGDVCRQEVPPLQAFEDKDAEEDGGSEQRETACHHAAIQS